jgi:hypothetical protein
MLDDGEPKIEDNNSSSSEDEGFAMLPNDSDMEEQTITLQKNVSFADDELSLDDHYLYGYNPDETVFMRHEQKPKMDEEILHDHRTTYQEFPRFEFRELLRKKANPATKLTRGEHHKLTDPSNKGLVEQESLLLDDEEIQDIVDKNDHHLRQKYREGTNQSQSVRRGQKRKARTSEPSDDLEWLEEGEKQLLLDHLEIIQIRLYIRKILRKKRRAKNWIFPRNNIWKMWITNNLSWTRKFTFVRNCVCRYEGFFPKRNALKKIRNC